MFDVCRLLGLSESRNNVQNVDEDDLNLLRLMTPICKLFTAKKVFFNGYTLAFVLFIAYIFVLKFKNLEKHAT